MELFKWVFFLINLFIFNFFFRWFPFYYKLIIKKAILYLENNKDEIPIFFY